jgi:hypothetical protein
VNAIAPCQPATADERTARHLSICAELIDLGMTLARAAAARATADWAAPATQPDTAAQPAAARKQSDPAVIFVRVTAAVRDIIKLEARLAAGLAQTAARPRSADPRRATLCDAFAHVTKRHPDRAELIRASTARLDEYLASDPEKTLDVPTLLWTICDELGIDIDLATLPDEYLGMGPEYEEARATSPP